MYIRINDYAHLQCDVDLRSRRKCLPGHLIIQGILGELCGERAVVVRSHHASARSRGRCCHAPAC